MKSAICICIQASSKTEVDRKRYSLPPTSSLFSISQKQLKGQLEKEGKIHPPSVDKQEWGLFGIRIHQPTSPLPEGEKKGKIHPPLVDKQEWNLLGIHQPFPSSYQTHNLKYC